MSLTNIMIKDSNCYASNATIVDKDGVINSIGENGEGTLLGTDWYVAINDNASPYKFKAFREEKIDLQGLEYAPIALLGYDVIESEVPSFYGKGSVGFMREYTILTTKRLSRDDLWDRIELFTAPLPFDEYRVGSLNDSAARNPLLTREQVLGGRSTLHVSDSSLPESYGFGRKLSNYDLNMGSEVSTDGLYYYRVIYAQGDYQSASLIFIDISARTTILTINVREDADDTQVATGLIRAYQAPSGSN